MIAHAQQMLRTDDEDTGPLPDEAVAYLLDWLRACAGEVEAVVLSDYGKGVVTEALAREAIAIAVAAGRPVVVDSKARDYARFRGATVLTPNQHDTGRAANVDVDSDETLQHAVDRLQELCGDTTALLVTRGAAGMTLFPGTRPATGPCTCTPRRATSTT